MKTIRAASFALVSLALVACSLDSDPAPDQTEPVEVLDVEPAPVELRGAGLENQHYNVKP